MELGQAGGPLVAEMVQAFQQRRVSLRPYFPSMDGHTQWPAWYVMYGPPSAHCATRVTMMGLKTGVLSGWMGWASAAAKTAIWNGHLQDFVVQQLRGIPGVVIPQPEGAFYALPEVSAFFGPGVEAEDFGSIPDVDTLCRHAPQFLVSLLCHRAYQWLS